MVLTRHGDRTPAFWANPANSIGSLSVSAAEAGFWVVDGPAANRSLIPSKEVVIRSLCLVFPLPPTVLSPPVAAFICHVKFNENGPQRT